AAWLGRALHPEVEDRQDLYECDLWNDDLTRAWIRGDATTEIDALATTDQRLAVMQGLCDALTTVEELQETLSGDQTALADAYERVQALGPEWEVDAVADAHDALNEAMSTADRQTREHIKNDVLAALAAAHRALDDSDSANLSATTAPDRLGGDLSEMIENAVEAFCEDHDAAH